TYGAVRPRRASGASGRARLTVPTGLVESLLFHLHESLEPRVKQRAHDLARPSVPRAAGIVRPSLLLVASCAGEREIARIVGRAHDGDEIGCRRMTEPASRDDVLD